MINISSFRCLSADLYSRKIAIQGILLAMFFLSACDGGTSSSGGINQDSAIENVDEFVGKVM